ncbi:MULTISPECIES: DUF1289 domain-containing protein [Burkholderiaceae]|uniref:Fe-S protein n=2 Tax=Burkholderiaceae TaxID=119060 RepID=A4JV62_BURVG|nr:MULTISPECIES: DUF1289 domain-containing protein [Burkholderiaceae]ABO60165.1 protein of unknown function DUF1289 [Burkholderia vietnamiensis G4]ASW03725.1 DUF1289 domain-containing protein [Paraburkholderia aromaticivorans]MBR8008583.1 DUF1289 domain-containing protein [Burkholderia vietnamiensis]MBR8054671.1 DUF1289 domain-containing protein [Burkholderia vietnamiensis]MCB4349717.1 DUF1289 domain-containing protein [Burkholderia vietnamiensis]
MRFTRGAGACLQPLVKSPCIDVCTFDGKTKLCIGCFRTLDEIRAWKKMTDHRRHQVINDRARRRAKLQREPTELSVEQGTSGN